MPKSVQLTDSKYRRLLKLAAEKECDISDNTIPKGRLWQQMGERLMDLNITPNQVNIVLEDDINAATNRLAGDGTKHSVSTKYFRKIMTKRGWKFDTRGNPRRKIKPDNPIEYNVELRGAIQEVIESMRTLKHSCSHSWTPDEGYVHLHDIVGKRKVNNLVKEMHGLSHMIKTIANKKEKIDPLTLIIFSQCYSVCHTMSKASTMFEELRLGTLKKYSDHMRKLSTKKFVERGIPHSSYLTKIKDRDTALFWGLTGVQCDACNSWNVKDNGTDLVCVECDAHQVHQTLAICPSCAIPLYKETLKKMRANKGKCIDCGTQLEVPKIMDTTAPKK